MKKITSLFYILASGKKPVRERLIARIIFAVEASYMVLLHGFIKKTQKTPKSDIDLAIKRQKEIR